MIPKQQLPYLTQVTPEEEQGKGLQRRALSGCRAHSYKVLTVSIPHLVLAPQPVTAQSSCELSPLAVRLLHPSHPGRNEDSR